MPLLFRETQILHKKHKKTGFPNPGIEPGAVRAVKDMKADDVNPYTNSEDLNNFVIQVYNKLLAFRMLRCNPNPWDDVRALIFRRLICDTMREGLCVWKS